MTFFVLLPASKWLEEMQNGKSTVLYQPPQARAQGEDFHRCNCVEMSVDDIVVESGPFKTKTLIA